MTVFGVTYDEFLKAVANNPPWYLTNHFIQLIIVITGVLLLAFVFWRQTEAQLEQKTRPDTAADESFNKIIQRSKWAKRAINTLDVSSYFYPPNLDEKQKLERALYYKLSNEIHDKLRQGDMSAWGKFSNNEGDSTPERRIDPEEWDDIRLCFVDDKSISGNTRRSCAYSDIDRAPNMHYFNVRFCDNQIKKLYPNAIRKRKNATVKATIKISKSEV